MKRQALHELFSQIVLIEFDLFFIIIAQKTLIIVVESSCGDPFDSQGLTDRSLDLSRLDPVAVDLDHISASAKQNIAAVRIPAGKIAGVTKAVLEGSRWPHRH